MLQVNIKVIFGQLLKERRKLHGLTQSELAEKCDLHHSFISLMERGIRQPTLETLLNIAKSFDTSLSELTLVLEQKLSTGSKIDDRSV